MEFFEKEQVFTVVQNARGLLVLRLGVRILFADGPRVRNDNLINLFESLQSTFQLLGVLLVVRRFRFLRALGPFLRSGVRFTALRVTWSDG